MGLGDNEKLDNQNQQPEIDDGSAEMENLNINEILNGNGAFFDDGQEIVDEIEESEVNEGLEAEEEPEIKEPELKEEPKPAPQYKSMDEFKMPEKKPVDPEAYKKLSEDVSEIVHGINMLEEGLAYRAWIKMSQSGIDLSPEELADMISEIKLSADADYKAEFKANNGADGMIAPDLGGLSDKQKKERAQLSTSFKNSFYTGRFNGLDHSYALKIAKDQGLVNDAAYKKFYGDRDFMIFACQSGRDEATIKHNIEVIRDLSGDSVDPKDPDYENKKKEVYGKRINELLTKFNSVDYEKYRGMSDSELVANWESFQQDVFPLSIAENALKQIDKTNPYINQELITQCNGLINKYNMMYYLNNNRAGIIVNPYYSTVNSDVYANNVKYADSEMVFRSYSDPALNRYINQLDSANASLGAGLSDQMRADLYGNSQPLSWSEDIEFYDKNGQLVEEQDTKDVCTRDGVIFAVDKYDGSNVRCYTLNLNTGERIVQNPALFLDQINVIKDKVKANLAKNERELTQTVAPNLKNFYNDINPITQFTVDVGIKTSRASNVEKTKEIIANDIKRNIVPESHKATKAEFYKSLNVSDKDQLGDEEIEARRKLSEKAIDKYVNRYTESSLADKLFNESNIKVDGCNDRRFKSFFFKPHAKYAQENLDLARKFFGLGPDNKSLNISPEELNKTRLEILKNRVEEYRKIGDSLKDIEFTDENIVEHLDELNELGFGMGMEWTDLYSELKEMGVNPGEEWEAGIQDLHAQAYYLKNVFEYRNTYIASPDYMFGAEEKMTSYDAFNKIMSNGKPSNAKTAFQVANCSSQLGNEIRQRADKILGFNVEDSEAVFDDKGNMIPFGRDGKIHSQSLVEAIATSKQIFVFQKGNPEPFAVDFAPGRFYPPSVSRGEVPPAEIEPLKFSKKVGLIEQAEKTGKMSKTRAEFETGLCEDEYELAIMTRSMKNAPEASKNGYRDSIREKLTDYVARLTLKKKLESAELDKDTVDMLCNSDSVKEYAKTLKSSKAIDDLIADVENLDYASIDGDKIYNQFLGHYKTEQLGYQKEKQKKTVAKQLETSKQIYSRVKRNMIMGTDKSLSDDDLWGLTEESKKIESKYAGNSMSRSRIQTIAACLMLSNGLDVSKIITNNQQMQEIRERAAKMAIDLIKQDKGRDIANILLAGGEKLNQFMEKNMKNVPNLSSDEFLNEKYKTVRSACTILKDIFQEAKITNDILQKDADEFLKKNPGMRLPRESTPLNQERFDKMRAINDTYAQMYQITTGGLLEAASSIRKKEPAFMTITTCLGDLLLNTGKQKYMRELAKITKEQVSELCSKPENVADATKLGKQLLYSAEFNSITERAESDPIYAKKIVIAMMDGTIASDEIIKPSFDKDGAFGLDIDIKALDRKLLDINPNELNKLALEEVQIKKEGEEVQQPGVM